MLNWRQSLALKSSRPGQWSKKRRDTSTAYTEHWPTPSVRPSASTADRRQERAQVWRSVGNLTSLGWMIVLPIAAGILAGRLIDGFLGTQPYATFLLLSGGIC